MRKNIFCVNCRASLLPPPCGARKTLRAFAVPCVFRPLRKKRAAFFYSVRRSSTAPSSPRTSSVPPAAALRFSHRQREAHERLAVPEKMFAPSLAPFFRPLRRLRPPFFRHWRREAHERLAVPGKRCGLLLFLAFFDRCRWEAAILNFP